MSKKISFISIILLGINLIVGGNIFVMPRFTYQEAGPYLLIILLFCALLSISIGLFFAEMSGKFTRSGSSYIYAKECFGSFVGFQIGGVKYFGSIVSWATRATALPLVLSAFYPEVIKPYYSIPISLALIVGFSCINLLGIKISTIFNNTISIAKILPLLLFMLTGLFFIKKSSFAMPSTIHIHTENLVTAFLVFFSSLAGFDGIAVASKDMENPSKNVPRAIITCIGVVSFMYMIIYISCIGILGPELMHDNNGIASAISKYMGSFGFHFVWIASLISIVGINFASSFETPRSLAPLAEDHFISPKFALLNKKGVPYYSILTTMLLAGGVASSGSYVFLAQANVLLRFVQYISTCLCVLKSRQQKVSGTFFVPFAPLLTFINLAVMISIFFLVDFKKLYVIFFTLISGAFIYFFYSGKKHLNSINKTKISR